MELKNRCTIPGLGPCTEERKKQADLRSFSALCFLAVDVTSPAAVSACCL